MSSTTTTKKRKTNPEDHHHDDADDQGGEAKKVKLTLPSEDDDVVVVVVGEKEFQETSRFLRSISDYFDGAFRSGMKESQEMKFEFPDQDPKAWKRLMKQLKPSFSSKDKGAMNREDALLLLPLLDMLLIQDGLKECDNILSKGIKLDYESFNQHRNHRLLGFFNKKAHKEITSLCKKKAHKENTSFLCWTKLLDQIIKYLHQSVRFNLKDTEKACMEYAVSLMCNEECHVAEERLTVQHLKEIPFLLSLGNEEQCNELWDNLLMKFLPKEVFNRYKHKEGRDALFIEEYNDNNLLPHLLYSNIQLFQSQNQKVEIKDFITGIKKTIHSNKFCREIFKDANTSDY